MAISAKHILAFMLIFSHYNISTFLTLFECFFSVQHSLNVLIVIDKAIGPLTSVALLVVAT